MANNNKKYLLLAVILFVFTSFLSAQSPGYFVEEKDDEIKYIQRFVWKGGENALQYDVVFERERNGIYIPYLKETTKAQYIEVSLPPGHYRFRVIPYDILGRPAEGSMWTDAEVLPVPMLEQYEEQKPEINTAQKPELKPKPKPEIEEKPEAEKAEEPEEPEKEKTVFFRIGALFEPRLTLYGGNEYFGGENINGESGGLRTSIVFKIPLDTYIGTELTATVNRQGNINKWKLFYYTLGLNILAEKWSPGKIFGVGFRMGVLYPSIDIKEDWREMNEEQGAYFNRKDVDVIAADEGFFPERLIPNIGASLYLLIKKHLMFELGFNYMHILILNDIDEYPLTGFFCPRFGISYQF
jgi:hypothetical protein